MLAAGRGLRFGGPQPKPLALFGGRPLVVRAVETAIASGLAPVLVVVSDHRVEDALSDYVASGAIATARNDDPEQGISSSLRAALRNFQDDQLVEGVVVGLADQPLVGAGAYVRVARAFADGARLAVATYEGSRGNPVLVGREHWAEAQGLTGDEGARVLMRRHGAVEVPCDGTGEPTDVDTPEDLAALEIRFASARPLEQ